MKITQAPSMIWSFIMKHSNVVIAVLVCLLMFFFYKINNDSKNFQKIHDLQMENMAIRNEISLALDLVDDQNDDMEKLDDIVKHQNQQMREANALINFLIEKLKTLGEWPPKELPSSPSSDEATSNNAS